MTYIKNLLVLSIITLMFTNGYGQDFIKTWFSASDSSSGYYIHCMPGSKQVKGVLIVLTGNKPEDLFPESKLQNVAYANDILTIVLSIENKLAADSMVIQRLNAACSDVIKRFSITPDKIIIGGHGPGGCIALRYAEFCFEHPDHYPIKPKGVFAINAAIDLVNQWHFFEREIQNKRPYAGEAQYFLDLMTKDYGDLKTNADLYNYLSPLSVIKQNGNEKFLKDIAVRMYYDLDVNWYIKERQRGLYDTGIPDASELILRLQTAGNRNAEFISADKPGVKSNGVRNVNAWSIVDEVDLVKWMKAQLDIADPNHYNPRYSLVIPHGWITEQIYFPIDFAPALGFSKGVEDLRFPPGFDEVKSDEYWSYAFLWAIDGSVMFDTKMLTEKLTTYYSGLVEMNVVNRKISREKVIPVSCIVKSVDNKTFIATIKMLDYKTLKPITLNVKLNIKNSAPGKSYLLVGISPQPLSGKMWQKLDAINVLFDSNEN